MKNIVSKKYELYCMIECLAVVGFGEGVKIRTVWKGWNSFIPFYRNTSKSRRITRPLWLRRSGEKKKRNFKLKYKGTYLCQFKMSVSTIKVDFGNTHMGRSKWFQCLRIFFGEEYVSVFHKPSKFWARKPRLYTGLD